MKRRRSLDASAMKLALTTADHTTRFGGFFVRLANRNA
jgi:hypothetical protein